jgi:hypothetical protein
MNSEIPTDWTPTNLPCTNCNNYTFTIKRYSRPTIVIRPTIELPALSFVGISAGPMLISTMDRTVIGWNVGFRVRLHDSTRKAAREKKWSDRYLAPAGWQGQGRKE